MAREKPVWAKLRGREMSAAAGRGIFMMSALASERRDRVKS